MNLADLRVLEAVAQHGSMNRAAAELGTVQSNVTGRIRALEDRLGTPLFERQTRGVVPTAACKRLLPYAARIGHLLREAEAAVRDDGTPRGSLRIGSLETTAALRLPPILVNYARAYPDVGLVVTTATSADLIKDVLEHRLDGAFAAGPVQNVDLIEETVFQEELVLVTPLSVRSPAEIEQLRNLKTIVFRAGCAYRQRLESILAGHGVQTAQPLEFGSIEAIIGCVAAGIGVTMLPKAVVANAWRDGAVAAHELAPELARVDTVFIRRRDAHLTSAIAALLAIARPPARLAAAE